eukprot:RCo020562
MGAGMSAKDTVVNQLVVDLVHRNWISSDHLERLHVTLSEASVPERRIWRTFVFSPELYRGQSGNNVFFERLFTFACEVRSLRAKLEVLGLVLFTVDGGVDLAWPIHTFVVSGISSLVIGALRDVSQNIDFVTTADSMSVVSFLSDSPERECALDVLFEVLDMLCTNATFAAEMVRRSGHLLLARLLGVVDHKPEWMVAALAGIVTLQPPPDGMLEAQDEHIIALRAIMTSAFYAVRNAGGVVLAAIVVPGDPSAQNERNTAIMVQAGLFDLIFTSLQQDPPTEEAPETAETRRYMVNLLRVLLQALQDPEHREDFPSRMLPEILKLLRHTRQRNPELDTVLRYHSCLIIETLVEVEDLAPAMLDYNATKHLTAGYLNVRGESEVEKLTRVSALRSIVALLQEPGHQAALLEDKNLPKLLETTSASPEPAAVLLLQIIDEVVISGSRVPLTERSDDCSESFETRLELLDALCRAQIYATFARINLYSPLSPTGLAVLELLLRLLCGIAERVEDLTEMVGCVTVDCLRQCKVLQRGGSIEYHATELILKFLAAGLGTVPAAKPEPEPEKTEGAVVQPVLVWPDRTERFSPAKPPARESEVFSATTPLTPFVPPLFGPPVKSFTGEALPPAPPLPAHVTDVLSKLEVWSALDRPLIDDEPFGGFTPVATSRESKPMPHRTRAILTLPPPPPRPQSSTAAAALAASAAYLALCAFQGVQPELSPKVPKVPLIDGPLPLTLSPELAFPGVSSDERRQLRLHAIQDKGATDLSLDPNWIQIVQAERQRLIAGRQAALLNDEATARAEVELFQVVSWQYLMDEFVRNRTRIELSTECAAQRRVLHDRETLGRCFVQDEEFLEWCTCTHQAQREHHCLSETEARREVEKEEALPHAEWAAEKIEMTVRDEVRVRMVAEAMELTVRQHVFRVGVVLDEEFFFQELLAARNADFRESLNAEHTRVRGEFCSVEAEARAAHVWAEALEAQDFQVTFAAATVELRRRLEEEAEARRRLERLSMETVELQFRETISAEEVQARSDFHAVWNASLAEAAVQMERRLLAEHEAVSKELDSEVEGILKALKPEATASRNRARLCTVQSQVRARIMRTEDDDFTVMDCLITVMKQQLVVFVGEASERNAILALYGKAVEELTAESYRRHLLGWMDVEEVERKSFIEDEDYLWSLLLEQNYFEGEVVSIMVAESAARAPLVDLEDKCWGELKAEMVNSYHHHQRLFRERVKGEYMHNLEMHVAQRLSAYEGQSIRPVVDPSWPVEDPVPSEGVPLWLSSAHVVRELEGGKLPIPAATTLDKASNAWEDIVQAEQKWVVRQHWLEAQMILDGVERGARFEIAFEEDQIRHGFGKLQKEQYLRALEVDAAFKPLRQEEVDSRAALAEEEGKEWFVLSWSWVVLKPLVDIYDDVYATRASVERAQEEGWEAIQVQFQRELFGLKPIQAEYAFNRMVRMEAEAIAEAHRRQEALLQWKQGQRDELSLSEAVTRLRVEEAEHRDWLCGIYRVSALVIRRREEAQHNYLTLAALEREARQTVRAAEADRRREIAMHRLHTAQLLDLTHLEHSTRLALQQTQRQALQLLQSERSADEDRILSDAAERLGLTAMEETCRSTLSEQEWGLRQLMLSEFWKQHAALVSSVVVRDALQSLQLTEETWRQALGREEEHAWLCLTEKCRSSAAEASSKMLARLSQEARRRFQNAAGVQRHARAFLSRELREELRACREAAVAIQRIWRGYAVRQRDVLNHLRQSRAAVVVQRFARGCRACLAVLHARSLLELRLSALAAMMQPTPIPAPTEAPSPPQLPPAPSPRHRDRAARAIQRLWRGALARQGLARRDAAARRIQPVWRGHCARVVLQDLLLTVRSLGAGTEEEEQEQEPETV